MPGVKVELVSGVDGAPTGPTETSDADGYVTFQLMGHTIFNVKLSKAGDIDSYTFGLVAQGNELGAGILSNAVVEALPVMVGTTLDTSKGLLIGTLLFRPDNGADQGIGCATVEVAPLGEIFYVGPDGPAKLADLSSTTTADSGYLALNLTAGSVTLTAKVGGTTVATGTALVFANSVTTNLPLISTGTTNPTPVGCTQ